MSTVFLLHYNIISFKMFHVVSVVADLGYT